MINDKIFCSGCNKDIDIYDNTTVKKNDKWDLYCVSCCTWLGGMLDLLGWEIS